jgi:DNA-binding transcriptional LysR family regulator
VQYCGADVAASGRWLPPAVRDFRALHPEVSLRMHQGSSRQVAEMLLRGEADLGVATEAPADYPDLVALPCYQWAHAVVVPTGHPLLFAPNLTRVAIRRGAYLRSHVYDFIQTFASPLTRQVVKQR